MFISTSVNGVGVTIRQRPNETINLRFIVNAGSGHEEVPGTAHFLEHMFFKGTTHRGYREINLLTAKLGDINAYTNRNMTVFHIDFLPPDLEEAVKVLAEMMFDPAFAEEEFMKERGVIMEECQTYLDDPGSYFHNQFAYSLMGPVGHDIIGSMVDIAGMGLQDLKNFRNRFYTRNNLQISVTGNVDPNAVLKALAKVIPELPTGEQIRLKADFNFSDHQFTHPAQQTFIAHTVASDIGLVEEIDANFIESIFNNGFGEGSHSLLFNRLREELGLCYSIMSYANALFGYQSIQMMLAEQHISQAYEEIEKVIAGIKANGFSDELLEISKKNHLFGMGKGLETAAGVNAYSDYYFFLGDKLQTYSSLEERRRRVQTLTNNDIIEYARRLYDDNVPVKHTQMTA